VQPDRLEQRVVGDRPVGEDGRGAAVARRALAGPRAGERAAQQPSVAEGEVAAGLVVEAARGPGLALLLQPSGQEGQQLGRRAPGVAGELLEGVPDLLQRVVLQLQGAGPQGAVADPGGGVEQRMVAGGTGVDGAPDAAAPHHRPRLVGLGHRRVGDAREARAQPGVWRAGGLRLDRPGPPHRLGHGRRVTPRDLGELPGQAEPAQVVPVVRRHGLRLGAGGDTRRAAGGVSLVGSVPHGDPAGLPEHPGRTVLPRSGR
jgi:hypothetical protein